MRARCLLAARAESQHSALQLLAIAVARELPPRVVGLCVQLAGLTQGWPGGSHRRASGDDHKHRVLHSVRGRTESPGPTRPRLLCSLASVASLRSPGSCATHQSSVTFTGQTPPHSCARLDIGLQAAEQALALELRRQRRHRAASPAGLLVSLSVVFLAAGSVSAATQAAATSACATRPLPLSPWAATSTAWPDGPSVRPPGRTTQYAAPLAHRASSPAGGGRAGQGGIGAPVCSAGLPATRGLSRLVAVPANSAAFYGAALRRSPANLASISPYLMLLSIRRMGCHRLCGLREGAGRQRQQQGWTGPGEPQGGRPQGAWPPGSSAASRGDEGAASTPRSEVHLTRQEETRTTRAPPPCSAPPLPHSPRPAVVSGAEEGLERSSAGAQLVLTSTHRNALAPPTWRSTESALQ